MCMCVRAESVCVHMGTSTCEGQKRASVLLELELQVVVRCVTWVVKTELGLSVEENSLKSQGISAALWTVVLFFFFL